MCPLIDTGQLYNMNLFLNGERKDCIIENESKKIFLVYLEHDILDGRSSEGDECSCLASAIQMNLSE